MDKSIIRIAEPSIGQIEYLKYLQAMSVVQKPTFMLVELELPATDVSGIERTVAFFLERHESLRTVFPVIGGEIRQMVLPGTDKRFQLEYVDVTSVDDRDLFDSRKEHFEKAAAVFADIENGPLVKLLLFRRGNGYRFSLLLHHIICDEWSRAIARQELIVIYQSFSAGEEPALEPLAVTLKDYCEQQNKWLYRNKQELTDFWRSRLQGFDQAFDINGFRKMYARRRNSILPERGVRHMPGDAELSAILDRPDASAYTCILSGAFFREVKSAAAGNNHVLSTFIYTSFILFLAIYTGKKKILVPALIADRYLPDHRQLIGCLLGSLYLPVTIREHSTIRDLTEEIDGEMADVIGNKRLIFSHNFLQLPGDRLRNCCDMYINYFNRQTELSADRYSVGQHEEADAIHYPIYAMVMEYDDAL